MVKCDIPNKHMSRWILSNYGEYFQFVNLIILPAY